EYFVGGLFEGDAHPWRDAARVPKAVRRSGRAAVTDAAGSGDKAQRAGGCGTARAAGAEGCGVECADRGGQSGRVSGAVAAVRLRGEAAGGGAIGGAAVFGEPAGGDWEAVSEPDRL